MLLALLHLIAAASAAPPASPASSSPPASAAKSAAPGGAPAAPKPGASAAPAGAKATKLIFDHWYTVTLNKVIHYEYFNERAEIRGGRLYMQNHAWKQEEDYINEEQLGAFAEATADLTPLFFNFHSSYRTTETMIDGTIRPEGAARMLNVRIRKASTELPVVRRGVPSKAFFSVFFPVWLGQRLGQMKEGQSLSFSAILEDNLESNFNPVVGMARLEKADEFAKHTKTQRLTVNFQNIQSVWWVDAQGAALRIENPLQHSLIERVPEKKAKAFLD